MNNILAFQKCSNCGACYNVCPKDAITLDEGGLFYELRVDEDKCVDCGMCQKVCPVNSPDNRQAVISAYGAIHNDAEVVKASSSGGAFSAIAEFVLKNGGTVFGAAYTDDCRAVEICSSDHRTLDDFRRSKYVESKVGYTFREVKSMLDTSTEKPILYCGLPCQVAGLKRYLGKEYSNLFTCDFTCNGVPSHGIYREYLTNIEKKLKAKICDVNFREKTYGWRHLSIRIVANNGRKYHQLAMADPYFDCFIGSNHHSTVREYCLTCDFANNHHADVILADFWKYQTISTMDNRDKGISLVITNSAKGEMLMQAISKRVALTALDLDKATYNLTEKSFSDDVLQRRNAFIEKVKRDGFVSATKERKFKGVLKFKIKYMIKRIIGKA
ncbi:MAG: Coenzyme F420 hydrogenase/dehydrogenase, beta subunit C-terminal domain [Clostridia bacterium]|nr:Coenzyme F420 hydrogenase/dehydrogenase, beta subunit C-terminal domain [Clostridia bacterium]